MTDGQTLSDRQATRHPTPDTLDLVGSLVDKGLVRREEQPNGEPRLRLLETLREFGLEQLRAGGELEVVRRRHAEYFLALAEAAEPRLRGADQVTSLGRLDRERDNFRAAIKWAIERGEAEIGLRLAGALWRFWEVRGHWTEGRTTLEGLLAEALVVTEGTAANYVQRVLTKLDFNTRAQIAAWAVEDGLGPSPARP